MHFYGDFYQLPSDIRCRSTLEIVKEQRADDEIANLSEEVPNLIVIMTNPGASRPTGDDLVWQQREPGEIGDMTDLREADQIGLRRSLWKSWMSWRTTMFAC